MTTDRAFTVAICTRNRAPLLRLCLEALTRSVTATVFPVLLVDNGSTDDTLSVAESFRSQLSLTLAHEPETGLSRARNRAVATATTEYVVFLDDDAQPLPGWAEAIRSGLSRYQPDVFGGPYSPFFLSAPPAWFRYGSAHLGRLEGPFGLGEYVSGGNSGWRVSRVRELGGFPVDLGMIGKRLGLGEENDLQDKIRRAHPEARFVFLPEMAMLHLSPPEKMKVTYFLKRNIAAGNAVRTIREREGRRVRVRAPLVSLVRLVGALGSTVWRDRQRFPYWQNHAIEKVLPHLAGLVGALPGQPKSEGDPPA